MAKAFDCPDRGHAVSKKADERPSGGRPAQKEPWRATGSRLSWFCGARPWLAIVFIV
jgi:hypothetical protein